MWFKETGFIARRSGSSRPAKITDEMKAIVERQAEHDDETTVKQLQATLAAKDLLASHSTVLRCRKTLRWTFHGSAYCQIIRDINKAKQLEWASTRSGNWVSGRYFHR